MQTVTRAGLATLVILDPDLDTSTRRWPPQPSTVPLGLWLEYDIRR